jgi:hypothetical protein
MELTEVKLAIIAIVILEVAVGALAFLGGKTFDIGTLGMGIAAIAGLAGYDTKKVT